MMDKREKNIKLNNFFNIFFHIALSSTIFQVICPVYTLFTNIRIDWICFVCIIFIWIYEVYMNGIKLFIQCFTEVLFKSKLLFFLCAVYFLWDSINLFYAQDIGFMLDKYMIWSKIAILSLSIIYYVNPIVATNTETRKIDCVILNLGITSIAICLIANIGYYTGIYTCEGERITTIPDYNVFSWYVMIGFVAGCYYIIQNKSLKRNWILLLLFVDITVCVPVIYLSASRRSIVLVYVLALYFIPYVIYKMWKYNDNIYIKVKNILTTILVCIIIMGVCSLQINFFNQYSTNFNQYSTNKVALTKNRIETIKDGSGLDVRKMIWEASINWYEKMTPIEKVFGGGASYDSDIFNDIDNPINQDVVKHYNVEKGKTRWMGAHNFLLTDLLNGGIIKLTIDILIMLSVLLGVYKRFRGGGISADYAIMLFILYVIMFVNLMLSSKYGLFGHRTMWIVFSLDFITAFYFEKEKQNVCVL